MGQAKRLMMRQWDAGNGQSGLDWVSILPC